MSHVNLHFTNSIDRQLSGFVGVRLLSGSWDMDDSWAHISLRQAARFDHKPSALIVFWNTHRLRVSVLPLALLSSEPFVVFPLKGVS